MLKQRSHMRPIRRKVGGYACHKRAEADIGVGLVPLRGKEGGGKVAHALAVADGGVVQGVPATVKNI